MKAQAHGLLLSPATEIEQYPGKGISGVVEHYRILIGHSHWLDELGFEVTEGGADGLEAAYRPAE